eukprot:scaffold814_cov100-Cylindrotheca_fusiformis.AAC.2
MVCGAGKNKKKDNAGRRSDSKIIVLDDDDGVGKRLFLPLNDMESGMLILMQPSIVTANFFSADEGSGVDYNKSLAMLKLRVKLICQANPWMVGRLVKKKKLHKRLLCSFPQTITDDDIDAIFSIPTKTESVACKELSSSSSSFGDMIQSFNQMDAILKPGYFRVNKDERVAKFVFMPIANGKEYLLLFSLCHCLADGSTYYRLLNMLKESTDIESLEMERIDTLDDIATECVGMEEQKLIHSKSLVVNVLWRSLFLPKLRVAINRIDKEKINKAKAKIKARHSDDDPNFFVSTNDIITSFFAKESNSETMLMVMDLRGGRHSDISKSYAGNYEVNIFYDRESKGKPEDIRASLTGPPPFVRISGTPMPTWKKMLFLDLSIISSWAFPTFDADLHLWDSEGKPAGPIMKLHLPAGDPKNEIPGPTAIIFKPCKGELAIMCLYLPKNNYHERMVSSSETVLGEKMC